MEPGVVIEPPEGRPSEDDEACAGCSEPLELPNRDGVIRRRSPVLAISFQEGNTTTGEGLSRLPRTVIDQNECLS